MRDTQITRCDSPNAEVLGLLSLTLGQNGCYTHTQLVFLSFLETLTSKIHLSSRTFKKDVFEALIRPHLTTIFINENFLFQILQSKIQKSKNGWDSYLADSVFINYILLEGIGRGSLLSLIL